MMSLEQQLHLAQSALEREWVRPEELRDVLRAWDDESLGQFLIRRGLLSAEQVRQLGGDTPLETDPFDPASDTLVRDRPSSPPPRPTDTRPSTRYTRLRPHARGGLGEVFLARDEELKREVALKEIQAHAADHPEAQARFVREAEITGNLEHPGIVPVYGLGAHANGRPWYAMRFIRGQSLQEAIGRYHQEKPDPLALRQLLNRFVAVCHAVGFGHSRGVIHRDLKPANVMLGDYGETLVVDWGLARRKDEGRRRKDEGSGLPPQEIDTPEGGTSASSFILHPSAFAETQEGEALGTPAYMPPEQARGHLQDVGPASDIFSLGATLYCLLTGQAPYKGYDALIQAAACDWKPARQLKREVPAALEAICARAMSAEPARRYTSARELGEEVERWLGDEPVRAHREPLFDRARRWARKHRTLVTGVVVLLLVSVIGLIVGLGAVSAEQGRTAQERDRARDAEQDAREEQARAEKAEKEAKSNLALAEKNLKLARKAVNETFDLAKSDPLLRQDSMRPVRKLLLEKALPFYKEFNARKKNDPRTRAELAGQQVHVGYITNEIGKKAEARKAYEAARMIYADLARQFPKVDSYRREQARSLTNLGLLLNEEGKTEESLTAYKQAAQLHRVLLANSPANSDYATGLAYTLYNQGLLLRGNGKDAEASKVFGEVADINRRLLKKRPGDVEYAGQLALALNNLGLLLAKEQKYAEARKAYDEALSYQDASVKALPDEADHAYCRSLTLRNLGVLLNREGKKSEGRKVIEQAIAAQRVVVKNNPSFTEYRSTLALTLYNQAMAYLDDSKPAEARPLLEETRDLYKVLVKNNPTLAYYAIELGFTLHQLGVVLRDTGKSAEALMAFSEAVTIRQDLAKKSPLTADYALALAETAFEVADVRLQRKEFKETLADFKRAQGLVEGVLKRNPHHAGALDQRWRIHFNRAAALDKMKRHPDAITDWEKAIRFAPASYTLLARTARAQTLARWGQHQQARSEGETIAALKGLTPEQHYQLGALNALCAASVVRDAALPLPQREKLAEIDAQRAMRRLRQAEAGGYFKSQANRDEFAKEPDFAVLRGREDFKGLVKGLGG